MAFSRKTDTVRIELDIKEGDETKMLGLIFKQPTLEQEAEFEDNRVEYIYGKGADKGTARGKSSSYKVALSLFDKLVTDCDGPAACYYDADGKEIPFNNSDKVISPEARAFLGINRWFDIFPGNVKNLAMLLLFGSGEIDVENSKKK